MTASDKVVQAWLRPGAYPPYHYAMQEQLKRDWPTLYNAIEELVKESK